MKPKNRTLLFISFSFVIFSAIFALCAHALFGIGQRSAYFVPPENDPHRYEKYKDFPTVIIDAGHGGEDGGAIGANGVFEKDLNLKIALELKELLDAEGIKARLTRSTDTLLYDRNSDYEGHKKSQDMRARLAIINEYRDSVFISIHMNSFPQSKYSGIQVYYSPNNSRSYEFAILLQELCRTNLQPSNERKIKPSNGNIYLLDNVRCPAVLIECGFLSNPEECEILCTEDYRKRLSLVIFSAIKNYFAESVHD